MNQSELEEALKPLRKDLAERIESRGMLQAIFNKHIQMIDDCINQNITISLIHANIFPENEISFNHLKNLIYRARAKLAKNNNSINRHIGGSFSTVENNYQNNSENAFSSLAKKEQQPIHNNSSDQKSADERLNKLLMQKKQQEALK